MTTQAHTPTPWYVDPKDDQAILATPPNGWQPTPQHPRWIVAQLGLYTSPLRSEIIANSAFIVQACNAYDANQALIAEQAAEIARYKNALRESSKKLQQAALWLDECYERRAASEIRAAYMDAEESLRARPG